VSLSSKYQELNNYVVTLVSLYYKEKLN